MENAMEQTIALELKNITKTFGQVVANKNVSLQVKKGEILSILGENGSGKTTLMNMISGIYHPDEGQIIINGGAAHLIKAGERVVIMSFALDDKPIIPTRIICNEHNEIIS